MKYTCMYCSSPQQSLMQEYYKEDLTLETLANFMAQFPVNSVFEIKTQSIDLSHLTNQPKEL